MIKFSEVSEKFAFPAPVERVYSYYAYKSGQSFGPFETHKEAKEVSNNVEKVWSNEKEFKERDAEYRKIHAEIVEQWEKEVRECYPDVSDAVYNLCFTEAYSRGHAYGYDEIATILDEVIDFALKITEVC